MKRAFFFLVIVGLAVAVVGYLVWLVIDALYSMYQDWRLGKELDELEAEVKAKPRATSPEEAEPDGL